MTKYFIDTQGKYIGGFDGAEPPAGSIEVPSPPGHAKQLWDAENKQWLPLVLDYATRRLEAYVAAGVTMEAIAEALIEHAGGKSQKLLQLMQLRDAVRAEIPKS
jgi:hypothetical protein